MAQNTKFGWRIRTIDGPRFFEKRNEALKERSERVAKGEDVEMPKKHALPAKMYKLSHKDEKV